MTITTSTSQDTNEEASLNTNDHISGKLGFGVKVSIKSNDSSALIEKIDTTSSLPLNAIDEPKKDLSVVSVKKKKRRKKKKKKPAAGIPLELQPWTYTNEKALVSLGALDTVEWKHIPSWIQNIVGNFCAIDVSISDYVWSDLTNRVIDVFNHLNFCEAKDNNLKQFLMRLPEELALYHSIIDTSFRAQLTNLHRNPEDIPVASIIRAEEYCIPAIQWIAGRLSEYREEIDQKPSRSYIKNIKTRNFVDNNLEKICVILTGIVTLANEDQNSTFPFKMIGIQTSHIVRPEESNDLLSTLRTIHSQYRNTLNITKYYQNSMMNNSKDFGIDTIYSDIERMMRKTQQLLKKPTIQFNDIKILSSLANKMETRLRNMITTTIDFMTIDFESYSWPSDFKHLQYEPFKSMQIFPEMILRPVRLEWNKRLFLDIRVNLDVIRFSAIRAQDIALRNTGFSIPLEKFDFLKSTLSAFMEDLDEMSESDDLDEANFVTAKGRLSFQTLVSFMKTEIEIINQVNINCPDAWCRLKSLLNDVNARLSDFFPEYLKLKATKLKDTVSEFSKNTNSKEITHLIRVLDSISTIERFLEIFEKYEPIITEIEDDLSSIKQNDRKVNPWKKAPSKHGKRRSKKRDIPGVIDMHDESTNSLIEENLEPVDLKVTHDDSHDAPQDIVQSDEEIIQEESKKICTIVDRLIEEVQQQKEKRLSPIVSKNHYQSPFNVTYRELVKELKAAGWKLLSGTKGGHVHFKHPLYPDLGRFPVPCHGNQSLSTGVVKSARELISEVEKRKDQF